MNVFGDSHAAQSPVACPGPSRRHSNDAPGSSAEKPKLGVSESEFEELDREVHELVEASVEFAKAGTDPKPEDALKNVYA